MRIEINIKAIEDELYRNTLVLYLEDGNVYNYGVDGLSHEKYGCIVARLNDLLTVITEKDIINKCRINNCTVRMGGLDFTL